MLSLQPQEDGAAVRLCGGVGLHLALGGVQVAFVLGRFAEHEEKEDASCPR
jgi:hypothetical protein